MQHVTTNVWTYRVGIMKPGTTPRDVAGYGVEARDGLTARSTPQPTRLARRISSSIPAHGSSGRRSCFPLGVIRSVDHENEKIIVDRTKDEIKNAPEFEDSFIQDEDYRGKIGAYYGDTVGVR